MVNSLSRHKLVILYGASLGAILLLLRWPEFRFIIMDHSFEVYIGAIVFIFTGLGSWLAVAGRASGCIDKRLDFEKKNHSRCFGDYKRC